MVADEDRWYALIRGNAPPDEAEALLRQAAEELEALVQSQPDAQALTLEVIGKRVKDGVDDKTWDVLDSTLSAWMGRGPHLLLTWLVLAEPADTSRLEQFEALASPEVGALVRAILSSHGPELREAFAVWRQYPNDWREFFRDVYQDQILGGPFLRVRLVKYNGEEIRIEGLPDSFLTLARNIILTLQLVATPEAFNDELKDSFEEAVTRLQRLMMSDDEALGMSSAAASATP